MVYFTSFSLFCLFFYCCCLWWRIKLCGIVNRPIVYKSKSLVRPHVEYCTPVWSPCYQKDKILIERVQHRLTRMIPGFFKLPYCERLKRLELWSLEEKRNRADLTKVFKMVKGLSRIPMESMFELSTTEHLRGHELKLTKHRSKLEVRQRFFMERLVNRWNSLDHHTMNASTVNSFKNGLQRLKQSRMGFFEDWRRTNSMAAQVLQQDWCGHSR